MGRAPLSSSALPPSISFDCSDPITAPFLRVVSSSESKARVDFQSSYGPEARTCNEPLSRRGVTDAPGRLPRLGSRESRRGRVFYTTLRKVCLFYFVAGGIRFATNQKRARSWWGDLFPLC